MLHSPWTKTVTSTAQKSSSLHYSKMSSQSSGWFSSHKLYQIEMETFSHHWFFLPQEQPVSFPLLSAWRILIHFHLKGRGNLCMKSTFRNGSEVIRETIFSSDNRPNSLLPSLICPGIILSCFFLLHSPKHKVWSLFKDSSSLNSKCTATCTIVPNIYEAVFFLVLKLQQYLILDFGFTAIVFIWDRPQENKEIGVCVWVHVEHTVELNIQISQKAAFPQELSHCYTWNSSWEWTQHRPREVSNINLHGFSLVSSKGNHCQRQAGRNSHSCKYSCKT